MATLSLAAIALAIVGHLLVRRFAGPIAAHIAVWQAQQRVLSLDSHGRARHWPTTQPFAPEPIDQAAGEWIHTFLRTRDAPTLAPKPTAAVDTQNVVYLGPLRNAAGEERIVQLDVLPSRHELPYPMPGLGFRLFVRDRVGLWEREQPLRRSLHFGLLPAVPSADGVAIEAPQIDPNDAGRLLLHGESDGEPFAIELTLDAADRVSTHRLPATSPTVHGP